jgi:hypothetical protein
MNREVAAWMRRDRLTEEEGFATPPFLAMGDGNSVMWNRQLSRESYVNPIDRFHACNMVTQALARIGAKRLVVGHTPQVRRGWGGEQGLGRRGRNVGREEHFSPNNSQGCDWGRWLLREQQEGALEHALHATALPAQSDQGSSGPPTNGEYSRRA